MVRRLAMLVASAVLAACAVGPDYRHPQTPLPADFSAAHAPSTPGEGPADPLEQAEWWKGFNDAELDRLVDAALDGNLDIQTATARIAQARAQADATAAGLFPSFSASAQDMRYRVPDAIRNLPQQAAGALPVGGAAAGAAASNFHLPGYLSIYRAGFDASWELDLWGGTRRQIEAANASAAALLYARRGTIVSTLAELGNDYASLRATQARIGLAQATAADDERLLDLTINRQHNGLASDLDVAQARSELADTQAQLPPLQSQAIQLIHAIAILLGREPQTLEQELGASGPPLSVPVRVPVGLPTAIILNRPDVEQADRQLAAANAQYGAAIAQRLPSIALTGSTGYASDALKDLLKSASWTWSAGGSLTAPIFDFGRLEANQRGAAAAANEQMLQYRKTVVRALQDIEDSLQQVAAAQRSFEALQVAVAAAKVSLQRATQQYRSGLASYLNVLQADRSVDMAQDQLAQSDQMRAQAVVSLYKALGGGWEAGEQQLLPQLRLDAAWRGPTPAPPTLAEPLSGPGAGTAP